MRAFSHFRCTVRSEIALHRADLREGESAEELEVDQCGEVWLNQVQFLQCVVDQSEFPGVDRIFQVIERDRGDVIPATLFRAVARTRVIDDEPRITRAA